MRCYKLIRSSLHQSTLVKFAGTLGNLLTTERPFITQDWVVETRTTCLDNTHMTSDLYLTFPIFLRALLREATTAPPGLLDNGDDDCS